MIELAMASVPLAAGRDWDDESSTQELLAEPRHTVVLGRPGAGKSTVLRGLAGRVALEPADEHESWRMAVVVVCREHRFEDADLYAVLGKIIGISGRIADQVGDPKRLIRDILGDDCLIVIDGLDEVPAHARSRVNACIVELGRMLRTSRLVVSCRSGDYYPELEGFRAHEILPLDLPRVAAIVKGCVPIGDAERFLAHLQAGGAAWELSDRPLFLIYMLSAFDRLGDIADRPAYLCHQITRLVLQDWDADRQVVRQSAYSNFGTEDKLDFVSEVALDLLGSGHIAFDTERLEAAYVRLAERFELPRMHARQVAREIESHTGLIVQAGPDLYQFSHRALQEFLAARALLMRPTAIDSGWWKQPAIAAVAVALSPVVVEWTLRILADSAGSDEKALAVRVFLSRLVDERPRMEVSKELGWALLTLLSQNTAIGVVDALRLSRLPRVMESVGVALLECEPQRKEGRVLLSRTVRSQSESQVNVLTVALDVFEAIKQV